MARNAIEDLKSQVTMLNKMFKSLEKKDLQDEIISSSEVLERLNISRQHLFNLRKQNVIRTYSLGGKNYFVWGEIVDTILRKKEVIEKAKIIA